MRTGTSLLIAVGALLCGACDSQLPTQSTASPSLLIGSSPLQPLQGPTQTQLWFWTDARTGESRYAATIEFEVQEELLQSSQSDLRFVASADFQTVSGKAVTEAGPNEVAVTSVSPVGSGSDGYALVVIAVPVSGKGAQSLDEAFLQEGVEMTIAVELVATAKDGSDDVIDSLGAVSLGDPHPCPTPIPDEFVS